MGGVSKAGALWRSVGAGAGLVGLAVSCGGDPGGEEKLATVQQAALDCSNFIMSAAVGSPDVDTFGSARLIGLPTTLRTNYKTHITDTTYARLSWSDGATSYECDYVLEPPAIPGSVAQYQFESCSPTTPPGQAQPFVVSFIETTTLTLSIVDPDVAGRTVSQRLSWGPADGCAEDACTPVTAGTVCDDSNICNGFGVCSPAGQCLEGTDPPDDDEDPCTLDACTECSDLDRTVATYLPSAYAFLYEGDHPVQTGLDPQDLQPERVSVVRGRVVDRAGEPIHNAKVTILPLDPSEPDFGETHTLSDGHYQMVTHGGGEVTVKVDHPDYLPILRRDLVLPNDARHFGDVVLTQPAPEDETALDLDDIENGSDIVVAMGSLIDDDVRGDRQAFVMFKPGTTAWLVDHPSVAAGTTTQLEGELTFHATEFTTGAEGMLAMPASLPPTSGYTYAISYGFSGVPADQHVKFSEPVSAFVEVTDFLDFDTGSPIPLGWLDMTTGAWVADESGEVIEVTGNESCGAETCATIAGATVALPDNERVLLAGYTTGTKLWRFEIDHFSYFDKNCGLAPPPDATTPNLDPTAHGPNDNPNCQSGSEIECESMVLGESLPLVGTPLTLHYRTDRVEGRRSEIRISLDYDHEELTDADVSLYVAGTFQHEDYAAPLPAEHVFTWDQRDFLGRLVQGAQKAIVEVGLWYNGTYADTPAFNLPPQTGGTTVGTKVRLYRRWIVDLGHFTAEPLELGGWTLGQHHFYDPNARRLYYGDGRRKTADAKSGQVVRTVLGGGGGTVCPFDTPSDPFAVHIASAKSLATGPDGSLYVADGSGTVGSGCWGIRRVKPDGDHEVVWQETGGSGSTITGLARGPDGSFYISRNHSTARRVDRLAPGASSPELFAGSGANCLFTDPSCGDGNDATDAQLGGPRDLAVTPDGSVLIVDESRRIRRVDPSGKIWTIAGDGTACSGASLCGSPGDLATDVGIEHPHSLALMNDGTVVFASGARVMAVTPDGRIWGVAGFGSTSLTNETDGLAANQLSGLANIRGLAAMPDGRLLIALPTRLLSVRPPLVAPVGQPNGSYSTVAGGYASAFCTGFDSCGDGMSPTAADYETLNTIETPVATAPDGRIFLVDGNDLVFAVEPLLPDFGVAWQIPSEDATELYLFDESGRHLETVDARTGTPLFTFGYDTEGLVETVADLNGHVTEITRSTNILIEGPFGKTTTITLDGAGVYATAISTPGNRTWDFTYDDDPPGLMLTMERPGGPPYYFTHDSAGRLVRDEDPGGGDQTLSYVPIEATSSTPFGYEVTHARPNPDEVSLDITGYRVLSSEAAVMHRAITWPLGDADELELLTTEVGDVETVTTAPDGTVVTVTRLPEQRWGMLAPMTTVEVASGGVSSVASLDRTVTLTDPADPLTLETLIETVTVDGKVWQAELDLTDTTPLYEVISPEGRELDVQLDAKMRPTVLSMQGIESVVVTYHPSGTHEGLIDKIEQGAGGTKRTLDFTYNGEGELWKVLAPEGGQVVLSYDDDMLLVERCCPMHIQSFRLHREWGAGGGLPAELGPPRPRLYEPRLPEQLHATCTRDGFAQLDLHTRPEAQRVHVAGGNAQRGVRRVRATRGNLQRDRSGNGGVLPAERRDASRQGERDRGIVRRDGVLVRLRGRAPRGGRAHGAGRGHGELGVRHGLRGRHGDGDRERHAARRRLRVRRRWAARAGRCALHPARPERQQEWPALEDDAGRRHRHVHVQQLRRAPTLPSEVRRDGQPLRGLLRTRQARPCHPPRRARAHRQRGGARVHIPRARLAHAGARRHGVELHPRDV
jgi:hypothetical protein